MQKTSRVPPFSFLNYTIDIQLRIYPADSRYKMEFLALGKPLYWYIDMKIDDLQKINSQLKNAIEGISADSSNTSESLRNIANIGHRAYNKIFGNSPHSKNLDHLFTSDRRLNFQITTEDFFIPWELIYPYNVINEALSFDRLWGFQHIISRIIVQEIGNCEGYFTSPIINSSPGPRFGLFLNRELEHVTKFEIPFFEKLWDDKKIVLFTLQSLDPTNRADGLMKFRIFWDHGFDIAHFSCHASYANEDVDNSHVLLSDDFSLSIEDCDNLKLILKNNPLVFLNACETGNMNPKHAAFFAKELIRYGARGVVATECEVPDEFAAKFIEVFYNEFLSGVQLGDSLLNTRRYFLENHNDPSGLLYSMYAPPIIRIANH
jgi:hypothetical protein